MGEMPAIEAKAKKEGSHVLAHWQKKTQQRVVDRWWQLATDLIVAYNDGFYNDVKTNTMGLSLGYPRWYAESIGFNQDVHPIFVKRDDNPELTCQAHPTRCSPDFQAPVSGLPPKYDFDRAEWPIPIASETLMSHRYRVPSPSALPDTVFQVAGLIGM